MIKRLAIPAAVFAALALFSSSAQAQSMTQLGQGHGLGGPTVSPYLNLLTVDNFGIAGGYQTLVKPFVDGRQAINSNAAQINQLQGQVGRGGGGGGAAGTGRYFMNYSHYYTGVR